MISRRVGIRGILKAGQLAYRVAKFISEPPPPPPPPIRVVANYNLLRSNGNPNAGELYFLNNQVVMRPHNIDADGNDVSALLQTMPDNDTATVTIDGAVWFVSDVTPGSSQTKLTVAPIQARPEEGLYEVVFEWPQG